MSTQPVRHIEAFYSFAQLQTASPGRRLGGWALDTVVATLTLGLGWLIWFLLVARRGQTPGKQMLGMYIIRADGTRAGGRYTLVREVLIKELLFGGVIIALGELTHPAVSLLLWLTVMLSCLVDRDRRCLWDKVAATYIAHSPVGFRPPTAVELRSRGEQLPATLAAPEPLPREEAAPDRLRSL